MTLGRDWVIVSANGTLVSKLSALGFEVAAVDMSEISRTGSGIHDMAQALYRVPA